MEEPRLQDYGIKPEEYAVYVGKKDAKYAIYVGKDDPADKYWLLTFLGTVAVVVLSACWIGYSTSGRVEGAIGWGLTAGLVSVLTGGVGVPMLIIAAIRYFKRSRLLKSHVASQIQLYAEARDVYLKAQRVAESARQEAEKERRATEAARWRAEQARRRGLYDHWMSLGGIRFERELGTLYRHLGFYVQSTPRSGDQGIDLILRRHGKTTVVQCKAHQSPIGPSAVRELFGAMRAYGADSAVLACTGGFTRGVIEFARGKPITLLSAADLATMGDSVLRDKQERTTRSDLFGRPKS